MKLIIGIIILLLIMGGFYLWNLNRKSNPKTERKELKMVNINELQFNEIVHEKLTNEQINRITNFQEILQEVNKTPIEKTIENFQRDLNPDKEITIWEHIAKTYQSINKDNQKLSLQEKNEIYSLILYRSMMPKEQALQKVELKSLNMNRANEFINYYDKY